MWCYVIDPDGIVLSDLCDPVALEEIYLAPENILISENFQYLVGPKI